MADTKPGKVLRVDDDTWDFILEKKKAKEKTSKAVRRLLNVDGKPEKKSKVRTLFVLPSLLDTSASEARGRAVLLAVQRGKKNEIEVPVKVKEVK